MLFITCDGDTIFKNLVYISIINIETFIRIIYLPHLRKKLEMFYILLLERKPHKKQSVNETANPTKNPILVLALTV